MPQLPPLAGSLKHAPAARGRAAWSWAADVLALAALVAAVVAFHAPALLWGLVYHEYDTYLYYYPVMKTAARLLRGDDAVLWTPHLLGGFPLLADGESGVFFPTNVLLLLLFPFPLAFVAIMLLRSALAGLSMYAFGRVWGLPPWGALVAALTFAFGSFGVAQTHHINLANGAALLPAVLTCAELALRAPRARPALFWSAAGGTCLGLQMLALHVQPVALTGLLLVVYLAYRAAVPLEKAPEVSDPPARRVLRAGMVAAGILGLGGALSAVQTLPVLELSAQTERGHGVSLAFATSYALPPPNLVTLLLPYFFRTLDGAWWTLWPQWEAILYVGVAPLALSIAGPFVVRTRLAWFLFGVIVVSALLALGSYLPLPLYALVWHLPGFHVLRVPARFALVFTFAAAWLAVLTLHELAHRPAASRAPVARRLGAGLAIGALALALGSTGLRQALLAGQPALDSVTRMYLGLRHDRVPPEASVVARGLIQSLDVTNPWTARQLGLLLATAVLLWAWARRRPAGSAIAWAWPGLVAIDLLWFAAGFHPTISVWKMDRFEEAGRIAQQYLAQAGGRMYTRWPSWETDPNQLLPFGVSDLRGYSTLTPARTERFLELVRRDEGRLLDLAGVTLLAVPPEAPEASSPAALYRGRGAVLLPRPGAWPRAYVAQSVIPATSSEEAARLLSTGQPPRDSAIVEAGHETSQSAGGQTAGQVRLITDGPRRVVLRAELAADGIVVLNDAWYPGWRATVDGRETPILPANLLFRAVVVPAGRHDIEFVYWPVSWVAGATVTLLGCLVAAGLLVWGLTDRPGVSEQGLCS
jgi:hypothetical protein